MNVKRMYMYLKVLDEKSRQAVMSEDVKALKSQAARRFVIRWDLQVSPMSEGHLKSPKRTYRDF